MKRSKYLSNFSTKLLSSLDIPPLPRILTMSIPTLVDIPPNRKEVNLSLAKQTCNSNRPVDQLGQRAPKLDEPPPPQISRWMSPPPPDLIHRQLNVINTLQMIDDALNMLNR